MESQETSPYLYGHLIIVRGVEAIQWLRIMFQQMVLGYLDVHMQKNQFRPIPHTVDNN